MAQQFDLEPVMNFLGELKSNNDRGWFEGRRAQYDEALGQFESYVSSIIEFLSETEPFSGLSPKDCIFRIYRDTRFSKDKSPYKTNMGAYIAPGGRKSHLMGYYVHIEPGASMLAGGLHHPDPAQLSAWRDSIDSDPEKFKSIVDNERFKKFFGEVQGEKLKSVPRGYPKDHPEMDLLRLKSVTVSRMLSDREVLASDFFDETITTYKVLRPFLRYMDSIL